MRNLLLTAAVLFSSVAFGQFGTAVQVQVQSAAATDTTSVGPSACGKQTPFTWKVVGTPCVDLSLWITTDSGCKDASSSQTSGSSVDLDSIARSTIIQNGGTGTGNFDISLLPIFSTPTGDGGTTTCGAEGIESTMRLCAATKQTDFVGSCNTAVTAATPLKIVYDTKKPNAPSIDSVSSLDEALEISFSAPSDAAKVRLVALSGGVQVTQNTQRVELGPVKLGGLENGVTYELQLYAIDAADNESDAFATGEGTPVKTLGFYEKYREAGGSEMGGCNAAGGGLAGGSVLAALGLWLFSRRNRS
ncbi:MAG: MXAN_2561 family MXYO-CTERM-anchored protein [Archangium sp.]